MRTPCPSVNAMIAVLPMMILADGAGRSYASASCLARPAFSNVVRICSLAGLGQDALRRP